MNEDGTEPEWPVADCIIGNPPFLGDKKMISEMGEDYVSRLRGLYKGRVPGGADLVIYWFEKARAMIESGKAKRAGLVATNSIRGEANRKVLDRIRESGEIFNAWSDEPWINEGAAVRVSLVCFEGKSGGSVVMLDGKTSIPEWVKRIPEVVPGYPDHILPVDERAAAELKKRTHTNLYNQRPAWLVNVHRELDEAVAAAYGWPAGLTDEEILRRPLELNLSRAGNEQASIKEEK